MSSSRTALLAPLAVAALGLVATPARAAGIWHAQYTRIVDAEVGVSPVPVAESCLLAFSASGAPGADEGSR